MAKNYNRALNLGTLKTTGTRFVQGDGEKTIFDATSSGARVESIISANSHSSDLTVDIAVLGFGNSEIRLDSIFANSGHNVATPSVDITRSDVAAWRNVRPELAADLGYVANPRDAIPSGVEIDFLTTGWTFGLSADMAYDLSLLPCDLQTVNTLVLASGGTTIKTIISGGDDGCEVQTSNVRSLSNSDELIHVLMVAPDTSSYPIGSVIVPARAGCFDGGDTVDLIGELGLTCMRLGAGWSVAVQPDVAVSNSMAILTQASGYSLIELDPYRAHVTPAGVLNFGHHPQPASWDNAGLTLSGGANSGTIHTTSVAGSSIDRLRCVTDSTSDVELTLDAKDDVTGIAHRIGRMLLPADSGWDGLLPAVDFTRQGAVGGWDANNPNVGSPLLGPGFSLVITAAVAPSSGASVWVTYQGGDYAKP